MTVCLSSNGETECRLDHAPERLFIGTAGGVFESRKTGDSTWTTALAGLGGKRISALVRTPDGRVFASVHRGGIYSSDDDGRTWQQLTNGIAPEQHVYSLAVAGETNGPVLYAGTEPVSLFRSDDLGRSWKECPTIGRMKGNEKWTFPPPPHVAHVKSITIDRRDPAHIYAAVEQGGLFESHDRGESWIELDEYYRADDPVYRDIHRMIQTPWNPDLFFIATGMGLYRSKNAGAHWEKMESAASYTGYPDSMIAAPSGEHVLFVAGAHGNPSTWLRGGGAYGGIARSHDEGDHWEPVNNGLPHTRGNVEGMAVAAHPGGYTLFAGSTDGEIFASADAGANWIKIATGLPAIAKGDHDHLLRVAATVPRWLRPAVATVAGTILYTSERRAAMKRERAAR